MPAPGVRYGPVFSEAMEIPFNQPHQHGPELDYIRDAIQRAHLCGDGYYTKKCHELLAERTGAGKVLLVHSGTAALEMAALLIDCRPGDEIIMPSYTFVSTANAFVLRGGVPVFVDIRPDTQNIDETLIEAAITDRTRAIREKDFTFSDEVLLSGTKEPIQELLRTKCALRVTDCKSIGNKIVLKGVARLDAIYLDESGNLASMSSELPFSQILDGLAEEEGEMTVRASLRLTGAEIHVGSESEPDNNRAISLRLYISAFTAVREVKSVCCVADLYSTAYDLTAKTETVELCDSAALVLREQLVREKIETGAEVQTVLATDVIFSSAGVSGGGESASLRATANLRVLYLDENAVPLLSERRSEVLLETDLPDNGQARVQDIYAGEIAASVGADGVELRFPVTFAVSVAETPRYPCLQSLEAEECGKKDENVPSLVLRAMKQGERLWDIAKLYRTTVEAILAANELKEESAAVIGKLLLIPRRR